MTGYPPGSRHARFCALALLVLNGCASDPGSETRAEPLPRGVSPASPEASLPATLPTFPNRDPTQDFRPEYFDADRPESEFKAWVRSVAPASIADLPALVRSLSEEEKHHQEA